MKGISPKKTPPPKKKARPAEHAEPAWNYGPPHELGTFGRVRAVPGFRSAVVELRPGMFLVSFVPVEAVEMGFLPLMAPALVKTVRKVFDAPKTADAPAEAVPVAPKGRFLPGPASEAPVPKGKPVRIPWLDGEVAEDLGFGCAPDCRCRRSE